MKLLVYPKTALKSRIGKVEVKINSFLTVAVN
jgi:hypothetical protein